MTLAIRPANLADPTERPFIVDGWINSFRTAHAAGIISMRRWRGVMWETVEDILVQPYVTTLVAADADDPTALYGFLAFEGPNPNDRPSWRPNSSASPDSLSYVHYAYTKEFRRRGRKTFGEGVMTSLLAAAGIDPDLPFGFACKTPPVVHMMDAGRLRGARWDPLRIRYERDYREYPERKQA